ncbi:hypothetical protein POM88_012526 [Heracleum sosnowskyi]|uniref:Uncharacterized protein n=1 Tax=Heracleum sosnowskyi TaxID=360622 RepID=A0AAD8IWX9_9APIA|nr:hypothetical protein POM88_012526 [Heracleum sosnowskyi]
MKHGFILDAQPVTSKYNSLREITYASDANDEYPTQIRNLQYAFWLQTRLYKGKFPTMLKSLENQDYTMKLQILEVNIQKQSEMYLATDMFKGFSFDGNCLNEETNVKATEISAGEPSGSSYHLDNMSEI